MLVYLIDDDEGFISFFERKIKLERDLEIKMFHDFGEVQIHLEAGNEPPDAVVLDYYMPGTDGLEMIQHLRKLKVKTKKVILLSGNENPDIIEHIYEQGVMDYVVKDTNCVDRVLDLLNTVDATKKTFLTKIFG